MTVINDCINKSKKIVFKLGSNTISDESGKINEEVMRNIVEQFVTLINEGKKIVIVSSGAVISGANAINELVRKNDINFKQALSAIGQVELMNAYKKLFGEYNIHVAQILLTSEDFKNHNRNLNIRNTLFTLIDEGVVPIINENDSVCIEEIQIGDNDTLSALTANLWTADLLVILSSIDGLYDKNPEDKKDAKLIEYVDDIEKIKQKADINGKSTFGTGGMATKLEAAKIVNRYNIPMIITNGKTKDSIINLKNEEARATFFYEGDKA